MKSNILFVFFSSKEDSTSPTGATYPSASGDGKNIDNKTELLALAVKIIEQNSVGIRDRFIELLIPIDIDTIL